MSHSRINKPITNSDYKNNPKIRDITMSYDKKTDYPRHFYKSKPGIICFYCKLRSAGRYYSAAGSSASGAAAGASATGASAAFLLRERRVRVAFLGVFSLSMFSL